MILFNFRSRKNRVRSIIQLRKILDLSISDARNLYDKIMKNYERNIDYVDATEVGLEDIIDKLERVFAFSYDLYSKEYSPVVFCETKYTILQASDSFSTNAYDWYNNLTEEKKTYFDFIVRDKRINREI